jgi:DNA-binding transcriptional MerR regulator/ABC-type Fe3+-hydroxamate transport system substrate-binding protein
MRSIGETAALAGVSVQTLRHYERLGLLQPRARSSAGYRLYGREELLRLREILIWRQLGFPLQDVAALIDDPDHDRLDALRRQREIVLDQHSRFGAMLRGLDEAIAATEAGRSPVESEVFRGFDVSLSTEEPEARPVNSRLRLVDGPGRLRRRDEPGPIRARRIVATDPIRIAENLLALGVMPVGVRAASDASMPAPFLPWPESVEPPVRDRVQNLGWGVEPELIKQAQPDLIVDLRFVQTGATGFEDWSDGQLTQNDLREIAPTVLLDVPLAAPGFVGRLSQIATALSVKERVGPLIASWHARIHALRGHIAGETVSGLDLCAPLLEDGRYGLQTGRVVNQDLEAQLFTTLGLELAPQPEGVVCDWGGSSLVPLDRLPELTAPTLFLSIRHAPATQFNALLRLEPLCRLPAVRAGRAFDLGWNHLQSGWFSSHHGLDIIAHAFGVRRFRSTDAAAPMHLAIADRGKLTLAATAGTGTATLVGPKLSAIAFEFAAGSVTDLDLGELAAADLSSLPEAYSISLDNGATHRLTHDRESALERVTQCHAV